MLKDIFEYREEYLPKRSTASANKKFAQQDMGLGSNFVGVSAESKSNLAQDYAYSEPNYSQDVVNYSESVENYAHDSLLPGEHDLEGVMGRSSDNQGYNLSNDHMHFYESEDYQQVDGKVSHEGQQAIEGTAEEVLEEIGERIPGVDVVIVDEDDDEEEDVETDWENDRDPKHFMVYITTKYPNDIPKHDGTSTLGCERAILFLNKLNKEISEALRADKEDTLDIPKLENIRVNLNKDILSLRNHANKLNKKYKKAEQDSEILKTASTPNIQVVTSLFERAIAGIITNAVVSSGKPLETVFEFLKKKYSLDEREELAIFQLLKDMGHPIFKDRGTLGKSERKEEGQGVEFIKNYFA